MSIHFFIKILYRPRNILVNEDCKLKIADFGLARTFDKSNSSYAPMSDYITTRWYRAPEVIVGWRTYGPEIDMWAVGTIIGILIEMLDAIDNINAFDSR